MALYSDSWSFDGKSNDEVVRAYSAFKGWRTRNVTKFEQLAALEKGSHSPISVASMITALEKIELYTDKLAAIAQYLEDNDHEKAKDYIEETTRWSTGCTAYAEHMMKLQHRIPLLQGGPIPPPSNPPSSSRPIIDLKPAELTSDSNMSVFRAWKRQFEAYYIISNMRFLSPTTQHAFLLKNVDHILSRRLVLSTTETTPILPNDDGDLSCFDVLGDYFQEVCPVLIRRQEFFSCRQNEGEDNSSFRDRPVSYTHLTLPTIYSV